MSKNLLIVESPAKAKTIGKYLGGDFVVKSSVGHIRDLPKEQGSIKITEVAENSWTFEPTYVVSEGKEKVVAELKRAVKDCDEIYLASDPDREGEAISWHLREVLKGVAGDKPFRRVTYNEITKSAVRRAIDEPRDVDMPLVDAQQARRILDRIVGYKVSPLLWKNINCANNRSLSAGRVQSVALRLLVERQREIDAFVPESYYLMGVEAKKPGDSQSFIAKLSRLDGKKPEIRDKESANGIIIDLADSQLTVKDVKSQPKTRHALPPFTTSTLQQAASSALGFSPGKTMKLAQALYEQGRITYMRTDSVNVSDQARTAARDFIVKYCGKEFYPEKPNFFKSKEDAQGAHEAIRPTDVEMSPKRAASLLDAAELKLYDLVWRRFVASQMADAKTTVRTISIVPSKAAMIHSYLFTASATIVDFEGFLKIMKLSLKKRTKDGEEDDDTDEVSYLPEVAAGDALEPVRWLSDEKKTKGPTHYSEASLIKALEENGVGRPSTYAQTIETLKAREYAKTEKKKLIPLERGILVCDWLVKKLDSLFSVGYTAQMETELDKVAEHGEPMNRMLSDFYSKFLKDVADCATPAPDRSKFEFVFSLLSEVKEWKPPVVKGKRTYDDKAFCESCREQFDKGERTMSARQFEFLVRMALAYEDQIADASARLKEAGVGFGQTTIVRADPEQVKFGFETMDRIPRMDDNPFLRSLKEQWLKEKPLSVKQFGILAKAVCEACGELPDAEEIRARLSSCVTGGFTPPSEDSEVSHLLQVFDSFEGWRPVAKRGKRVYDDHGFYQSLKDQFARRHSLSPRQVAALKRLIEVYKDKLPSPDDNADSK